MNDNIDWRFSGLHRMAMQGRVNDSINRFEPIRLAYNEETERYNQALADVQQIRERIDRHKAALADARKLNQVARAVANAAPTLPGTFRQWLLDASGSGTWRPGTSNPRRLAELLALLIEQSVRRCVAAEVQRGNLPRLARSIGAGYRPDAVEAAKSEVVALSAKTIDGARWVASLPVASFEREVVRGFADDWMRAPRQG